MLWHHPAAVHLHLSSVLPPIPIPAPFAITKSVTLSALKPSPLLSADIPRAINSDHQLFDQLPQQPHAELNPSALSRLQNARSAALFIHQPQPPPKGPISVNDDGEQDEDGEELLQTKKKIVEEYSLATRRTPRFPGSIDFPQPDRLDLLPGLQSMLGGDDRALSRALEVRRGVAAETLKDALRSGKLSINYSKCVVSRLPEFVDRIVIGAAGMKAVPELAHLSFNARVKNYIQSSGVVALVKWLKHNHLTYPQIGRVICMCPGDLQLVRHSIEWLKSIHVKGECLGAVLMKAVAILERSSESLDEIINCLEQNGVKKDWMGFVVSRCPQLLVLTTEELETRIKFFVDMGISEKDFGTMVFDYPRVLGFFSLDDMARKVQYLKEFGLSTEDTGRLLAFKPQLMGCSIEERWMPLVKYLYYLGVQRDGMKRILVVKPMIFCVDLETTIAPKVRFLQDIGVRSEEIGNVLVRFPSFLTYNLYKKIRPVVIFLLTRAGVSQNDIGKVIALDPQLVGCSIIHKLDVNVKYYLSLGIRLQTLGMMIADFPMMLRYNVEILRPKYRYLRRIMVRPLQDLIEFPRFFSYSLEGRIIPRHKIMIANRVNFKLRYMLAGSDEAFNQRVQAAVEKRRTFESGYIASELSDTAASLESPVIVEPSTGEAALIDQQSP